ncbi:MAG: acyl--CoA ligase [Myxococcales bacterium]|nr:acyl--CoA ligase [Myxococcales bacterium]MCB9644096.1 acyl--CoA ligase [Myxococcales bacterium]
MFDKFLQIPDSWKNIGKLLLGEGVHLGRLTAVLGESYAERPAIVSASSPLGLEERDGWTYAALEHDVSRLAAAHQALGHGAGCRVLILLQNRIDVLFHLFAVARAGGIPVPVNARLKADELAAILEVTQARAVIADSDVLERMQKGGILTPEISLCWSGVGMMPQVDGCHHLVTWLDAHPTECLEADEDQLADPNKVSLLLCTSGTTGKPKAAALTSVGMLGTLGRLLAAPVGFQAGLRKGRDVLMCALPLTHVMGLSAHLAALCAGIRLLHLEKFDADDFLSHIESERPNVIVGVPTMYADLERGGAAERDLSSVQLWVSGADVMPPDRARRFQKFGAIAQIFGRPLGSAVFADIYGMVELSGPMALRLYPSSPSRQVELPALSFVLPGFEVRAVDEKGQAVGWGQTGSLQVRGPGVLKMYEGAASAGPDAEGWFATGDIARVWPGGLFSFVGRNRDRLKVGGFSVFPAEVEEILRLHPEITDVTLVGLPDSRLGERPVALVVPKASPERFDTEAFLAWAADRVAGYRRPRQVFVVHELPRGNHGKINRSEATNLAMQIASQSGEFEA